MISAFLPFFAQNSFRWRAARGRFEIERSRQFISCVLLVLSAVVNFNVVSVP